MPNLTNSLRLIVYSRINKIKNGFTLVELMVVIAIIAILATVGMTVFGNIQKTARDARRKADIVIFAKAFDMSKADGVATYPTLTGTMFANALPVDPLSGRNYCISWSLSSAGNLLADPEAWTASCTPGTALAGEYSAWAPPEVDSTPPDATAYKVRICASLETSPASVFCTSTQMLN